MRRQLPGDLFRRNHEHWALHDSRCRPPRKGRTTVGRNLRVHRRLPAPAVTDARHVRRRECMPGDVHSHMCQRHDRKRQVCRRAPVFTTRDGDLQLYRAVQSADATADLYAGTVREQW